MVFSAAEPPKYGYVALVIILVGVVLFPARFLLKLRQDARRRAQSGIKPPVRHKLLRPPGYQLVGRLDDLYFDIVGHLLSLGLAGAIFVPTTSLVGIWVGFLLHGYPFEKLLADTPTQVLATGVGGCLGGLLWVILAWRKCGTLATEIRNVRLGLRGEQAVAEFLSASSVIAAGYRAFHDVPGDGPWNVDHVVVGPGGVVVIETKTRSKRPGRDGQPSH